MDVREALLKAAVKVFAEVQPLDRVTTYQLRTLDYVVRLFGAISLSALVLALSGIYAAMSFAVSRRTREIGIRVALGASRARVMRQVIGEAVATVVAGSLGGVALSLVGARALSAVLYGVSPFDPVSYLAALGLIVATTAIAAVVPARRAATIDPIRALRA